MPVDLTSITPHSEDVRKHLLTHGFQSAKDGTLVKKKINWMKLVSLILTILPIVMQELDADDWKVTEIKINRDLNDFSKVVVDVSHDGETLVKKTAKAV